MKKIQDLGKKSKTPSTGWVLKKCGECGIIFISYSPKTSYLINSSSSIIAPKISSVSVGMYSVVTAVADEIEKISSISEQLKNK